MDRTEASIARYRGYSYLEGGGRVECVQYLMSHDVARFFSEEDGSMRSIELSAADRMLERAGRRESLLSLMADEGKRKTVESIA